MTRIILSLTLLASLLPAQGVVVRRRVVSGTVSGSLSGSVTTSATTQNLTTLGTTDWAHWGDSTASLVPSNRMSGGSGGISNLSAAGGTGVGLMVYSNDARGLSWTNGTPTGSSTTNKDGTYYSAAGVNSGFRFTVPATTTSRVVYVFMGAFAANAKLTAHLSDSSAPDYVNSTINPPVSTGAAGNYTITYNAASPGQTLTVTIILQTDNSQSCACGNVTMSGVALQ